MTETTIFLTTQGPQPEELIHPGTQRFTVPSTEGRKSASVDWLADCESGIASTPDDRFGPAAGDGRHVLSS